MSSYVLSVKRDCRPARRLRVRRETPNETLSVPLASSVTWNSYRQPPYLLMFFFHFFILQYVLYCTTLIKQPYLRNLWDSGTVSTLSACCTRARDTRCPLTLTARSLSICCRFHVSLSSSSHIRMTQTVAGSSEINNWHDRQAGRASRWTTWPLERRGWPASERPPAIRAWRILHTRSDLCM